MIQSGTVSPDGGDRYATAAGAYDLFASTYRPGQVAALEALRPRLLPAAGPILDVGAGSAINSAWVLTRIPEAEVVALEPSPAMRSLALARVAERPDWFGRITLRPEDFFSAPLPAALGGAILLGVVGHFDPTERVRLFAELASRLPDRGAALIDLQDPETPTRMEPFEFAAAQVGSLSYRGTAEGWPAGGETMRWRMTYHTVDGDQVLIESSTEHVYHHPSPATVAGEINQVGMRMERIGGSWYWLLISGRRGRRPLDRAMI